MDIIITQESQDEIILLLKAVKSIEARMQWDESTELLEKHGTLVSCLTYTLLKRFGVRYNDHK